MGLKEREEDRKVRGAFKEFKVQMSLCFYFRIFGMMIFKSSNMIPLLSIKQHTVLC